MSESNALEGLVGELLLLVEPLRRAFATPATFGRFLSQIGWSARTADIESIADAVDTLIGLFEGLGEEQSFELLAALVDTLGSLSGAADAIADFAQALAGAAGDPAASAAVLGELAADLHQHLTLTWIAQKSPTVYSTLSLVGIIERRTAAPLATPGADPLLQRIAVDRPTLAFDVLANLLRDPAAHLRARLGVQQLVDQQAAENMLRTLFGPIRDLVIAAGGAGGLGTDGAPDVDAAARRRAGFSFPLPVATGDIAALRSSLSLAADLVPAGATSVASDLGPGMLLEPGGNLSVVIPLPAARLEIEMTAGFSVFLPNQADPVVHATTSDGVHLRFGVASAPAAGTPAIVVGSDTLGLTISGIAGSVESRFGRSGDSRLDLQMVVDLEDASFRLAPGEGDGFLGKVLPPDGIRFDFELGIGWSTRRGLFFSGSASLEADIPLHASLLGVLTIDILHLRLAAGQTIDFDLAATAALKLGPVAATVERMGLSLVAEPRAGGGNVGPFDLRPAFIPPRGVGLIINASVVTGGGFILNDPANGRYAGILQLKIGDVVVVTAIGLITTKMPDGSRGFSMLIIITAEFPPIQLGFGFTLSGLGGLLGVNRTMNVQALRDGVRTGVLDSILFPVDPVARATKVISDIEAVFPVAEGRFVIGLMARIGWGSPRLVTVDLGIIVELPLPLRIALLGRIGVILPNPEAAVVELHLDVIGILDLGRGELSIDATLHDSRVAVFDIYGDMALRLSWGATQVFIISVGGLNPRFERPPGLPDLRRLTIALAAGETPSVKLEAYLAVTSNSIQTGARLSAHAELDAGLFGFFEADAYLGFDALITLVPFSFIVDIAGGVVIRRDGAPFIGAEVLLTLHGPQPMRAVGYAEVHYLGTHRVPFDVTVGEEAEIAQLPSVDPTDELVAAISRVESWSAMPPREAIGVALRELPAGQLIAHPMGNLTFKQRIVPLSVPIERFGGAPIAGGRRAFTLTYKLGTNTAAASAAVREAWAPAEFFALSDDEKISQPSFQQLPAGSSGIGPPEVSFGAARQSPDVAYETRVIDEDELARPAGVFQTPVALRATLDALDASHRNSGYGGPDMQATVSPQRYCLADTAGPGPSRGAVFESWIEADQALAGRPGEQVVGAHEVAP